MRNSLKMDVLDELRLFLEKRLSNSTFCTPRVSYLNLNMNLKLESETIERIVQSVILAAKGDSHDNSGHSAKAYLRHKSH